MLDAAGPYLTAQHDRLYPDDPAARLSIFDPFGGTGRIHQLHDEHGDATWAGELEREWVAHRPDRTVVADALHPPFRPRSFDVVFTSPCYGNRFADTYAGDAKKSKRYSYRIYLERMPTVGSAAIMAWGSEYRRFHEQWLGVALDQLGDDGLLIVNMSNHLRTLETGQDSVEMHVVEWYVAVIVRLGFRLVAVTPVDTPRNSNGANAEHRAETEFLIVARRPPARELREAATLLSAPQQLSLI